MNPGDRALLKAVLLAVHVGADHFKWQGPLNKHHFAIGTVGNALGFNVQRLDVKVRVRKSASRGTANPKSLNH